MSDSPTPETDAERIDPLDKDGNLLDVWDYKLSVSGEFVPAEFAKRLERQRDEAWRMTGHQWLTEVASRLVSAGCKSDGILDSIDQIIRKRNEARREIEALKARMKEEAK